MLVPPPPKIRKKRHYICTDLIWGAAMKRRRGRRRSRSRTPIILQQHSKVPQRCSPTVVSPPCRALVVYIKTRKQSPLGNVVQALAWASRRGACCSQSQRKVEPCARYTADPQPSRVHGLWDHPTSSPTTLLATCGFWEISPNLYLPVPKSSLELVHFSPSIGRQLPHRLSWTSNIGIWDMF